MPQLKDRRILYALRLFLLVLLPFLLGAFVLPHTQYVQGRELQAPDSTGGSGVQTYAFVHSDESSIIQQKISGLFPLAGYLDFQPFVYHNDPSICFEDTGSYLLFQDGSTAVPDYEWVVDFNGATHLAVPPFSANCTPIVIGKQDIYKWNLVIRSVDAEQASGNVTFVPQTSAYTRLTMDYGILQGVILIPVAFLLVWYPSAGIIRKIKSGLSEQ